MQNVVKMPGWKHAAGRTAQPRGNIPNQTTMARSVGQPLLNNPPLSQHPAGAGSMVGIARLIRQVCLLRECGEAFRAAQLHDGELADAVRDYRLAHGPAALPESELRTMFALEDHRVAEAVILSELLLPRLVQRFPDGPGLSRSPAVRATPGAPTLAPGPSSVAGPPAITDLLDAMLAAERHHRPPAPATRRES